MMRKLILTMFMLSSVFALVYAQSVPQLINYQGKLTNISGEPLNSSTVEARFLIYSSLSGTTVLWSETHSNLQVSNGIYNVLLGSISPITSDTFSSTDSYMEVILNGETMTPRQRISSVPFALKCEDSNALGGKTLSQIPDYATSGKRQMNVPVNLDGDSQLEISVYEATRTEMTITIFQLNASGSYSQETQFSFSNDIPASYDNFFGFSSSGMNDFDGDGKYEGYYTLYANNSSSEYWRRLVVFSFDSESILYSGISTSSNNYLQVYTYTDLNHDGNADLIVCEGYYNQTYYDASKGWDLENHVIFQYSGANLKALLWYNEIE